VGSGNIFIRNLFSSGAFLHQKPFFIKNVFSSGAFCCQEPFIIKKLFSSGTFFIQEVFSIGALLSQECFLWEPISRSLLSRNLFSGTFWYREPFSQELYLQEFCGNFLAGTLWQERFKTPPLKIPCHCFFILERFLS
jgi:hypothetical protein